MMDLPFALSIHHFVSSVGDDAGVASIIGLVILVCSSYVWRVIRLRGERPVAARRPEQRGHRLPLPRSGSGDLGTPRRKRSDGTDGLGTLGRRGKPARIRTGTASDQVLGSVRSRALRHLGAWDRCATPAGSGTSAGAPWRSAPSTRHARRARPRRAGGKPERNAATGRPSLSDEGVGRGHASRSAWRPSRTP